MMRTDFLLLATILLLWAHSHEVNAANIEDGKAMSQKLCSSCHMVTPNQAASVDAAPTFESIGKSMPTRPDDLRIWLADPHEPMPKFDLTRQEMDDILAYIESLGGN